MVVGTGPGAQPCPILLLLLNEGYYIGLKVRHIITVHVISGT